MNFRHRRLQSKEIIRDKGDIYIFKEQILEEDITILNMYVSNNTASNYIRQKLIELNSICQQDKKRKKSRLYQ